MADNGLFVDDVLRAARRLERPSEAIVEKCPQALHLNRWATNGVWERIFRKPDLPRAH